MSNPMYHNMKAACPHLAAAIENHPNYKLFFVGKMWERYYVNIGRTHQDVLYARIGATVACLAHMDNIFMLFREKQL